MRRVKFLHWALIRAMEKNARVGWRELDLEAELRHEFMRALVRRGGVQQHRRCGVPMRAVCTIVQA